MDLAPPKGSSRRNSVADLSNNLLPLFRICSIRLAPPLVISEADLQRAVQIIKESLSEIDIIDKVPGDNEEEHEYKQVLEE